MVVTRTVYLDDRKINHLKSKGFTYNVKLEQWIDDKNNAIAAFIIYYTSYEEFIIYVNKVHKGIDVSEELSRITKRFVNNEKPRKKKRKRKEDALKYRLPGSYGSNSK